jgi:hypothetical protein
LPRNKFSAAKARRDLTASASDPANSRTTRKAVRLQCRIVSGHIHESVIKIQDRTPGSLNKYHQLLVWTDLLRRTAGVPPFAESIVFVLIAFLLAAFAVVTVITPVQRNSKRILSTIMLIRRMSHKLRAKWRARTLFYVCDKTSGLEVNGF